MPFRPVLPALLAAALLSSCSGLPPPLRLMFHPAEQVRHGTSDLAAGYYRLGRYHQDRGDLGLALTAYTYASARDPRAPDPRIAAAVIHAQQGRLAQAKAMLLAVCAEHPALAQPLNNLGYVYYLEGDYNAAAEAFRGVLTRDPGSERARNNLRLAEGAGVRGAAALATVAPLPVQPAPAPAPVATPAPVQDTPAGSGMQVVKVAPNVYALQKAPGPAVAEPAALPRVALDTAGAGVLPPLEIANGHGADGLARRFQDALAAHGIVDVRLSNAKPFGQPYTWVEYGRGHEEAARSLLAALGGKAKLRPASQLAAPAGLRLLLGKDAAPALAQALRPAPMPALLASRATVSP
ncbi:LytR C-terminal domain-containing protein [Massilia sp. SYSU DXS3249]